MPSQNHIAANTDAIADAGKHYEGALAPLVNRIRSELEEANATYGQPGAYGDLTGKAFEKVFGPAKDNLELLLRLLTQAFRQATEDVMDTADALAKVEEKNVGESDFGRKG
ncbi:hypothetical protein [Streptomyces chartreusis]|uniref:hypothetical protein n=1 Tax=Streptomyces chartreusis TaxID=1969 RepID=UPI0037F1D6D6